MVTNKRGMINILTQHWEVASYQATRKKRVAWYPLFAHVRPLPEKPGNPHMLNCSYNRYVNVCFISVSSMMAASLLILLACRMVFRQIDAQKVSGNSTLGSWLLL